MPVVIKINSNKRNDFIDITSDIQKVIDENKINNGICFLHVPHTTAGITINENADPDVIGDIISKTTRIFPQFDDYRHIEKNSDAHIKTSLFGPSLNLIIEDGRLILGTWQAVYFCEFDGPRNRKIYVKILKDV